MKRCQGCGKETNLIVGLGPVLLCRDECYPDANIDREATQSAGEQFDVTIWARRRLKGDYSTPRVNERNAQLNAIAQEYGYESMSSLLTAWKNGEIAVSIEAA